MTRNAGRSSPLTSSESRRVRKRLVAPEQGVAGMVPLELLGAGTGGNTLCMAIATQDPAQPVGEGVGVESAGDTGSRHDQLRQRALVNGDEGVPDASASSAANPNVSRRPGEMTASASAIRTARRKTSSARPGCRRRGRHHDSGRRSTCRARGGRDGSPAVPRWSTRRSCGARTTPRRWPLARWRRYGSPMNSSPATSQRRTNGE